MCPTDGPMARGARGDTLVYDIPGPGSVDLSLDSAREGGSGWVGDSCSQVAHGRYEYGCKTRSSRAKLVEFTVPNYKE